MKSISVVAVQGNDISEKICKVINYILMDSNYNSIFINNSIESEFINDFFNKKGKSIVVLNSNSPDEFKELVLQKGISVLVNLDDCNQYHDFYQYLRSDGIIVNSEDNKGIYKHIDKLTSNVIIIYGLSSRATLTASSINQGEGSSINEFIRINICLQRGITDRQGYDIEPMEFPVSFRPFTQNNEFYILPIIAVCLIFGIPVDKLQASLNKLSIEKI